MEHLLGPLGVDDMKKILGDKPLGDLGPAIDKPNHPDYRQRNPAAPATFSPSHTVHDHLFTVDACGGDAELICVLQKVMERFCGGAILPDGSSMPAHYINAAAVAEWFYEKYGKP